MSERTESTSAVEDALQLMTWGTRFVEPDTEAAYRHWYVRASVPEIRATTAASLVGIVALVFATYFAAPDHFAATAALVGALLLLLIPAFLLTRIRWVLLTMAVAHTCTGFVVVAIGTLILDMPGVALGLTLICALVGLHTYRLRLEQAVAAVVPYVVGYQLLLARSYVASRASHAELVLYSYLVWVSLAMGLVFCVVLERSSRRTFRQERIIQAQKETIALERAKSEALLKKELSHQVAERSRELGDALARVGAPKTIVLPVPGERFHTRYRVVRALGEGGMGAVFEVERLTDSQHLALKVVTGNVSGATAARFAREAEIGARVHHANLVSIVDVGIAEGGAPFLVMDLVTGGSLEGRRDRFGEVAWGIPILKQIALGLSALHNAGVVHRDLKPGNVLLDGRAGDSPVAKISDFGISRFGRLDEAVIDVEGPTMGAAGGRPNKDLTGTGALLGTPLYMAPEAARGGRALDTAADVFAFGIVAYEVLTGRSPFETAAVLVTLSGKPLPTPTALGGVALAGGVRDMVLACLVEDPKGRPTARRICEALDAS